jgi:hypothetical protein
MLLDSSINLSVLEWVLDKGYFSNLKTSIIMKQAKFALFFLALVAFVSSAMTYKGGRGNKFFYKYTTSVINGQFTGICDQNQSVNLQLTTVAVGGIITTLSATPATSVVTCTARVIPNL